MDPSALLGPPELYAPSSTANSAATPATSGDPFVDLMVAEFNKAAASSGPANMASTENGSSTYLSSGNPCLDFFFHVVPDTPPGSLTNRLLAAWAHDPLTALKLVCNLRGVRGTGKSDKEGFYAAALWLFKNHPRTLACNVGSIVDFGCFKDLPEILFRLLEGLEVRRLQKQEWLKRKGDRSRIRNPVKFGFLRSRSGRERKGYKPISRHAIPREERVAKAVEKSKLEEEKARNLRRKKRVTKARKLIERYGRDSDFRFLYDKVSAQFAESLRSDMESLGSGRLNKIGLAAKWCPSVDSSYDRSLLLCESIGKLMFPRDSCPEYDGLEEAHYAYRVRDRLRKEVLVPLRKALELPEVYMDANQWGLIPYCRVASVAMKLYKNKFMKHDEERFRNYLRRARSGKAKIAAGALLPHEISEPPYNEETGVVAELQSKRMVKGLRKSGKIENCIAVSDVSRSMSGTPMDVAIKLGILVSNLSVEPWKGKMITFSDNPQLHSIVGDSLAAKVSSVGAKDLGGKADLQQVFDLIIRVAKMGRLSPDRMVRRVFIFSDMEFYRVSRNPWETDYMAIKRKFGEAGYGDAVPEIVFWNLRNSKSTPVSGAQDGAALVSGFSKNLLNLFLGGDEPIDPVKVMVRAISGQVYEKLVIID